MAIYNFAGLQWHEQYNIHTAKMGRLIRIEVAWDSSGNGFGYKISVNEFELTRNIQSLADAQLAGIALAIRLLSETNQVVETQVKKHLEVEDKPNA